MRGLAVSMVFVPVLSWTEDDKGSLGELSLIGVQGFDRVARLSRAISASRSLSL